MIETRQPTIDRAMSRVNEEIDIVRTEKDAFKTFRKRLNNIEASRPDAHQQVGGPIALTMVQSSQPSELRQIRQAYRETVMGVPHYDQEYDDTLRESVAEELSETVACHVVDGQVLTPASYTTIVEATESTVSDRDKFLHLLDRERKSLRAVAAALNEVETRLVELHHKIDATDESGRLAAIDETLQTAEQRCAELATERQERIHNRTESRLSGLDVDSLPRYLYSDMETVTPALADIASCIETVRHHRMRCLR